MTFLNRKQKREAERNLRRGKVFVQKEVDLPSILDTFTIFNSVEGILKSILKGEISVNSKDEFVFRNNSGELKEVVPSILMWVDIWNLVSENCSWFEKINMESMISILESLNKKELIKHEQIMLAIKDFESLRKFYNCLSFEQRDIAKKLAKSYEAFVLIERLEKIKEKENDGN